MSTVDKDTAIAKMTSLTGCEDFNLLTRLLEENAWCVELAIETYNNNNIQQNRTNNNNGASSSSSSSSQAPLLARTPKNPKQQMFKAPDYAERYSEGWRKCCENPSKKEDANKFILINIQDDEDFASFVLDRDVWRNPKVTWVAFCYYRLVQIWRDGANYRDFVLSYPDIEKEQEEFPLVVILDPSTMKELKRLSFKKLMALSGLDPNSTPSGSSTDALQLSAAMTKLLTEFAEGQILSAKKPSAESGENNKTKNQNDDDDK